MANYNVVKITISVDGKEYDAFRVTEEEMHKENQRRVAGGKPKLGAKCDCSKDSDICDSDGYLWICHLGDKDYCHWWKSTWRCNP